MELWVNFGLFSNESGVQNGTYRVCCSGVIGRCVLGQAEPTTKIGLSGRLDRRCVGNALID